MVSSDENKKKNVTIMHDRRDTYSHFLNNYTQFYTWTLSWSHCICQTKKFEIFLHWDREIVKHIFSLTCYVNRCRCVLLTKHHRNKAYEFKLKSPEPDWWCRNTQGTKQKEAKKRKKMKTTAKLNTKKRRNKKIKSHTHNTNHWK